MPHALDFYLVVCFLWASHSSILSQSLQWDSIAIFVARAYLRGRHYGELCRPMSIWTAALAGVLSDIPTIILLTALSIEAFHPTLGDDECVVVADAGPVAAMHPGYAGTEHILDSPAQMPPDGLCLYHCLVAARDYVSYMAMSVSERVTLAEQLRQKSIGILKEHGLSNQAARLGLSGSGGYPDEENFMYLAKASGISFEIEGSSPGCVPHYEASPVAARVLFRKVADGAGHLSDHFDLSQA